MTAIIKWTSDYYSLQCQLREADMLEIQPVLPSFSVVKPKKIKRDDRRPEKPPHRKKQEAEEQDDAEPMQHIDEVV
jgi:hypothetical protein